MPSAYSPVCTQSGSHKVKLSRFFRKIISVVVCVFAELENVSTGSLIAPTSSALSAIYFLTSSFTLSKVPVDVIKHIRPPGTILSSVFSKK